MTLAELSAAWQSLRDAVIGRSGFEHNVSPELEARFVEAYERWRRWYTDATPDEDLKGSFGTAEPHIAALRELVAAASAQGHAPKVTLATTPKETVLSIGRGLGVGLAVLGAGVGVLLVMRGRNR